MTADLPAAPADPDETRPGTQASPSPQAPSDAAHHLSRQRRRLRRRLVDTVAVPAVLVAALSAVMAGYYVYVTFNSVLRPADFAALGTGDDRAAVQHMLPPRELFSSGAQRAAHPEPPGTQCSYYRPDANVLGLYQVYRLCFAGNRLVAKDVLYPYASGSDDSEEAPPSTPSRP